MKYRNCPICLSKKGKVLHHQSFETPDDFKLPSEYDVVKCKCGFIFADVDATQEDYTNYYRELAKYERKETTTAWDVDSVAGLVGRLDLHKDSSILDIGCATGYLLELLEGHGYKNLTGIDLSKKCLERIEKKGFSVFHGDFLTNPLNKKFDCIILSHVLEHVYDLQKAVKVINGLLRKGGILYVEVPDVSRYDDYYIKPFHYFDHEHINHFDNGSLENLFDDFLCIETIEKKSYVSNKTYPAIYGVYRKFITHGIKDYIDRSSRGIYPSFDKLAETQEPIIVWGVGAYCMRLLKNTSLGKCNIRLFVDKNRKGRLMGLPIKSSPGKYKGRIVVASAIHREEILNEIKIRKNKKK